MPLILTGRRAVHSANGGRVRRYSPSPRLPDHGRVTLLLTRNDLETLLDPADCLAALRGAFRTAGASPVPGQRVVTGLPFPGTATALLPGLLPGSRRTR